MNWRKLNAVMEQDVIKTDNIAAEDAYFMATHMPFSQLEVTHGGSHDAIARPMHEDEVFDRLIANPENEHRLIIVRGDSGTGKSHLIRHLKARFENSSATIYNPETEQLVFLRRLNNSIRGAFAQLLEENVIRTPEVVEKIKRFVSSSDGKDEASMKLDILHAYIVAVQSDQSGKVYKPVICRSIASYLQDSRVQEHLLREGGAISNCYDLITASTDKVMEERTIFDVSDFNNRKINRAVMKGGDPLAEDFAGSIHSDEDQIQRLVTYLNRFTREVVQRCADLSSESAKSIFVQLRKDLYQQGKNLTIFIEDFTGFTGVDSELITVLSTEHGGEYSDICRVTAVLGLTNAYYTQFRDNFTDRVTHQIIVTEQSFGSEAFLVEMTARYMNAIFCDPQEIRDWFNDGAKPDELPSGSIPVPCKWDKVRIGSHDISLYPFNRRSVVQLYSALGFRSPRTFLKDVLRNQLHAYFYGKLYGDAWDFPLKPENITATGSQASASVNAIDRMEELQEDDRRRLKTLLTMWGDGSTAATMNDKVLFIGGLPQAFLEDIGLGTFQGIGHGNLETTHTEKQPVPTAAKGNHSQKQIKGQNPDAERYARHVEDIRAWFEEGKILKYHPDYRTYLRAFLCGESRQCGAITWQDSGIPAYVANERLSDLGCYYIDGQDDHGRPEKCIVHMERSVESRDALLALVGRKYADGWVFNDALYLQQRLILWLERNKASIMENTVAAGYSAPKYIEWCLAIQYLKARILGQKIDVSDPIKAVESLCAPIDRNEKVVHITKEWNDLIQFIIGRDAEFKASFDLLMKSAATVRGAISVSKKLEGAPIFRSSELLEAAEHLIACKWDIEAELPESLPANHLLFNQATLLLMLYSRVRTVVNAEQAAEIACVNDIRSYLGTVNRDSVLTVLNDIQQLFATFNANNIFAHKELAQKYDRQPIDIATPLIKTMARFKNLADKTTVEQLSGYSNNGLRELNQFLEDLKAIERLAERNEAEAIAELNRLKAAHNSNELSVEMLERMRALCDQIESMEVSNADS